MTTNKTPLYPSPIKLFVGVALLATLTSCVSFAPLPVKPVAVPTDFVGLCPLPGNPNLHDWQTYAGWKAKAVRQGFFWGGIEPKLGVFQWQESDAYVNNAEKRGLQVLVVLDYDTGWLYGPNEPHMKIGAAQLPAYLAYVRAVVERYKGRISVYEIWNEPNLGMFWQGSRDEYARMAGATTDLIHQLDPHAKVAVGALSLVPHDWLETLSKSGVLAKADDLSIHPYWLDAQGSLKQVDDAQAFLRRHHLSTGVIVTEIGYPTSGLYPTATNPKEQATRLLQFYSGAAARGVAGAFWYESADQSNRPGDEWNSEDYFGLLDANGNEKPGVTAFKVAAQTLPDSHYLPAYWGTSGSDQVEALTFEQPNKNLVVYLQNTSGQRVHWSCPLSGKLLWTSDAEHRPTSWASTNLDLAPLSLTVVELTNPGVH